MKKYILIILSAILASLTITYETLWIIAYFALVPYLYIIIKDEYSYKKALKFGFIFGFIYYLKMLHWILVLYPLDRYGISNIKGLIVLVLGLLLICIYEGILMSIIPIVYKLIKLENKIINTIIISILWIIVEWIQQLGPLGFSWGRLALSQVKVVINIQSASVFGSLFITFILVWINGLITLSFINRNYKYKYLSVVMIILIFNTLFGLYNLKKDCIKEKMRVALIQGNISSINKWKKNSLDITLNKYIELSYEASNTINNIDYIVWPETAIPTTLSENNDILNKCKVLSRDTSTQLIIGTFSKVDQRIYNSIYCIDSDGKLSEPYFKRHLVPFGEFIPFNNILTKIAPFLKKINLFENNIIQGDKINIISTEGGDIGGLICFESIFPNLSIDLVREGAKVIVLLSNDSWFKDSRAMDEHFNHSILRAVETNRYIIRSANTGITAIIDNNGLIRYSMSPLVEGFVVGESYLIEERSIYSYVGDIIVFVGIILLCICYGKRYFKI